MKITNKHLNINVTIEDVTVGSVKADVSLMVFVNSSPTGDLEYDVDVDDYSNVKFEGMEIDSRYNGQLGEIKEFYKSNGVDLFEKINKQALDSFNITKLLDSIPNLSDVLS